MEYHLSNNKHFTEVDCIGPHFLLVLVQQIKLLEEDRLEKQSQVQNDHQF